MKKFYTLVQEAMAVFHTLRALPRDGVETHWAMRRHVEDVKHL